MQYNGKYNFFNNRNIKNYFISDEDRKVSIDDIIIPNKILEKTINIPSKYEERIEIISDIIVKNRKNNKPVILFTGAHLIKNGLSLIIIDLIKHDILTLVAGNGATAIHDFELAMVGQTGENVPKALEKGQFGMSFVFDYLNAAISLGNKYKLGFGETLGKMICECPFSNEVFERINENKILNKFLFPKVSIIVACYEKNIPFTVHVGIGTDVIDQHQNFDGEAKGGCSGRDFLIFVKEIENFYGGGVFLNVGSAITGPEVLLKATSMVANIGKPPLGIVTADFDLRKESSTKINDESAQYYYRDQKSIVHRIPDAFNGIGFYIEGDQKVTIPLLYKKIMSKL